MPRRGLVLINLGTPDAPTPAHVRTYLEEFLMDPYVIDIPAVLRWLLVHGLILRKRPAQSAKAYAKIWTSRGSPLSFHLEDLVTGVQESLDSKEPGDWRVVPAMRYGNPSIESAFLRLRQDGIGDAVVLPLYPQYSLAATESSVVMARRVAERVAPGMRLRFVPAFHDDAGFLDAFARVARPALADYDYDHALFSFHGLPERQVRKTDPTGAHCLKAGSCCDRITDANRDCYRAQCFSTARGLAERLGLSGDRYSVSFQSRLGRTPWIRPFTDELYAELPKKGIKRLAVFCPAFVADCLETLEEIQIRGREDFISRGGEDLRLVPSLNASPAWVSAVSAMGRRHGPGSAGEAG